MSGIEIIQTSRLALRKPEASDQPEWVAMHLDQRVMATLGGLRAASELELMFRKLITHWETHGFGHWIARDRINGQFVGRGGLRFVLLQGSAAIELGYGVVAEAWGKGFATEIAQACLQVGFERLGMKLIVSYTLPTNTASRNVMQKCGMSYVGPVDWAGLPHVLYERPISRWPGNVVSL